MTDARPPASPDNKGPGPAPIGTRQLLTDIGRILENFQSVGRMKFWIALLLLVLSAFSEGVSILMLLPVLQLSVGKDAAGGSLNLGEIEFGGLTLPDITITLPTILLLFIGFVVLQVGFNRMRVIYLSDLMFDFVNARRRALFHAIGVTRWDRIVRTSTSELEHALTGEVDRIATCGMYILTILQGVILLTVYITLSFATSAVMTAVIMVFGITAFVLMRPFRTRAAAFGQMLQKSRQHQFKTVSEFLGGLKGARATNSEIAYYDAFSNLLLSNKKDARDYARHNSTGAGLFQIMTTVGAALFIYIAVTWIALDFARMVIMLLLAMRIAPKFLGLQSQIQQLFVDLPAWRQVNRIQQELTEARDDSVGEGQAVPPLEDKISLREVTYHYDAEGASVLDRLSLTIHAHRVTALIGASGSGKSTIADLITGLIRPDGGTLLFDGRSFSPPELRGWRDRVSYVSQDTFLMNSSIRDNLIAMVGTTPSDAEIWDALERACAKDFVTAMPEGLDTELGDRGVRVSGGQRQRIALARAFLRKPDLLVLDEATSALDWAAQEHVAQSVREMAAQGMTVLTIAHRPSMVAFADYVYALEAGRVIESGRRQDLEKRPESAFYRMLQAEKSKPISQERD